MFVVWMIHSAMDRNPVSPISKLCAKFCRHNQQNIIVPLIHRWLAKLALYLSEESCARAWKRLGYDNLGTSFVRLNATFFWIEYPVRPNLQNDLLTLSGERYSRSLRRLKVLSEESQKACCS